MTRVSSAILVGTLFVAWPAAQSRQETAALQDFLKAAADAGIGERGITKALFEGRLNPTGEQLQLVFQALGEMPENDETRRFREELIRVQRLKPGEPIPRELRMGLDGTFRTREWNRRFGSIGEIDEARTIRGGREVTLTGKDLLLQLLMRNASNRDSKFWTFGLPDDPSLTYRGAIARLTDPTLRDAFEADLRSLDTRYSAMTYFMLRDLGTRAFDFGGDYEVLRTARYLPGLRAIEKRAIDATFRSGGGQKKLGDAAPDFTLTGIDGKPVRLTSFRGRQVVLVWFPFLWQKEQVAATTEHLLSINKRISEISAYNAVVIAASASDADSLRLYARALQPGFAILSDADGKATDLYGGLVPSLGTTGVSPRWTFYISPTGIVQHIDKDVEAQLASCRDISCDPGATIVDRLRQLKVATR